MSYVIVPGPSPEDPQPPKPPRDLWESVVENDDRPICPTCGVAKEFFDPVAQVQHCLGCGERFECERRYHTVYVCRSLYGRAKRRPLDN